MRNLPLFLIPLSIPALAFAHAELEEHAQERFKEKISALEQLLAELKEEDAEALEPEIQTELPQQKKFVTLEELLKEQPSASAKAQKKQEEEAFLEEDVFEWDEEKRRALSKQTIVITPPKQESGANQDQTEERVSTRKKAVVAAAPVEPSLEKEKATLEKEHAYLKKEQSKLAAEMKGVEKSSELEQKRIQKALEQRKIALATEQARLKKEESKIASQVKTLDKAIKERRADERNENRNPILFPLPQLLDFRHVQGSRDGIGFGTNYSTFAMLMMPDCVLGRVMPLIDLRAHHFDNNTYAANAGIGFRYVPSPGTFCELLGFNTFYDFRQGNLSNYHQVGVGIEILGKRWDFRANGYFPIGVKSRKITCTFDEYEGDFFAINRRCEFTAYGFNAEVGYYPINSTNFSLYIATGPYYLLRRCERNTLGGEARIRPQYKDYLAVEFIASYDPVFKAVYQGSIILHLPLYQIRNKCRPCGMQTRQVYQPIERFEIMPLGRRSCWERNF